MIKELEKILNKIFIDLGYEIDARVIKSNRLDLCDYQCDNAFMLAKTYHKSPIEIGNSIVDSLKEIEDFNDYFEEVTFAPPGFINMKVSNQPPTFNIQVNSKGLIHFSYERYLENKIRESFDFEGTPIVLQFKNKGEQ